MHTVGCAFIKPDDDDDDKNRLFNIDVDIFQYRFQLNVKAVLSVFLKSHNRKPIHRKYKIFDDYLQSVHLLSKGSKCFIICIIDHWTQIPYKSDMIAKIKWLTLKIRAWDRNQS